MNIMEVKFSAKSENESLARVIVASFAAKLDPTIDELSDIKTAVSEAVTNAIIHGYEEDETKFVHMRCELIENTIKVVVEDYGNRRYRRSKTTDVYIKTRIRTFWYGIFIYGKFYGWYASGINRRRRNKGYND